MKTQAKVVPAISATRLVINVLNKRLETMSVRFLVKWFNENFDAGIKRLEDLSNGAIYCQIIHKLFPASLPLRQVKFTIDCLDFENNYTVMRKCFIKLGVIKIIPDELMQGRGHLDFANWIFKFHQANNGASISYNTKKEREMAQSIERNSIHKINRSYTLMSAAAMARSEIRLLRRNTTLTAYTLDASTSTDNRSYRPEKELQHSKSFTNECKAVPLPRSNSDYEEETQTDKLKEDLLKRLEAPLPMAVAKTAPKSMTISKWQAAKRILKGQTELAATSISLINAINLSEFKEPPVAELDLQKQLVELNKKFHYMQLIAIKHSTCLIKNMGKVQGLIFGSANEDVKLFQRMNTF